MTGALPPETSQLPQLGLLLIQHAAERVVWRDGTALNFS
jgi:hypothetical protein